MLLYLFYTTGKGASVVGLIAVVGLPCRLVALSLLLQIQLQQDHFFTRDYEVAYVVGRESNGCLLFGISGTTRTSLIVTIGPSPHHRGETVSTILFGQREDNMCASEELAKVEKLLENEMSLRRAAEVEMQRHLDRLGSGNSFSRAHTLMLQGRHSQIKGVDNGLKSSSNSLFEQEVRLAPHMGNLVNIYKSMEVASGISIFVSQNVPSTNISSDIEIIPQDLLKKYITYAKLNVFPRLHDADMDKLIHVYAELRRESSVR
ncbi:hypothetical protein Ancab_016348 [Ancistrocladus abbreviatus]